MKKSFKIIIIMVAILGLGIFDYFVTNKNKENKRETKKDSILSDKEAKKIYYAKYAKDVDDGTGTRSFPVYEIFASDTIGSKSEKIVEVGDTSNYINGFELSPKKNKILIWGEQKIELFDIATKQKDIIYDEKESVSQEDREENKARGKEYENCLDKGLISNIAISSDWSRVLINREDAFGCNTGRKVIIFNFSNDHLEKIKVMKDGDWGLWGQSYISENKRYLVLLYDNGHEGSSALDISAIDLFSSSPVLSFVKIHDVLGFVETPFVVNNSKSDAVFVVNDNDKFIIDDCDSDPYPHYYSGNKVKIIHFDDLEAKDFFIFSDPLVKYEPIYLTEDTKTILVKKEQLTTDKDRGGCVSDIKNLGFYEINTDTKETKMVDNLELWKKEKLLNKVISEVKITYQEGDSESKYTLNVNGKDIVESAYEILFIGSE